MNVKRKYLCSFSRDQSRSTGATVRVHTKCNNVISSGEVLGALTVQAKTPTTIKMDKRCKYISQPFTLHTGSSLTDAFCADYLSRLVPRSCLGVYISLFVSFHRPRHSLPCFRLQMVGVTVVVYRRIIG